MQNDSGPPLTQGQEADWDAIARFVAGESDPAESRAVEAWLAANPADAGVVAAVQARAAKAERRAQLELTDAQVETALDRVRSRIEAESGDPAIAVRAGTANLAAEPSIRPQLTVADGGANAGRARGTTPRSPAPRVAAAAPRRGIRAWQVAALASAAALVLVVVRQVGTGTPTAAQVYTTQVGARDSVQLSDGSRVILAPGSTLTVAAGYGEASRELTLDGAAFFDVKHDDSKPFIVKTKGAEIRDLGTAFSVKTDAAGGVSVAVTHGIVALRGPIESAKPAVELRAGDRGVVHGADVAVSRGSVTADDVAWTRGQLVYHDTPLLEVRDDLRRWYGLELKLDGADMARRTLTATMAADSSANVLKVIALALGADIVQRGDTVILQMAGRSTTP